MKLLIFGAGVIGSLYAERLFEHGHEVTLIARGKRLEELRTNGLRYYRNGTIHTCRIPVREVPDPDTTYDVVLVAVKEYQLRSALEALRTCRSDTVCPMVNTLDSYQAMEEIVGKGRILPAFPGAGGGFRDGVLDAAFTPGWIQPTTFGEIDGSYTPRIRRLKQLFRLAGIPCAAVSDMHTWQLCHLGLVVPLADAYYNTSEPMRAGHDWSLMKHTAGTIRKNLNQLQKSGVTISPVKLNALRLLPTTVTAIGLGVVYRSAFGMRFMYAHAMKAPEEMKRLHELFEYALEELK